MVAVGKGFIDIVTLLHMCPFIDINHQDNDGNTALMIAAQTGMSNDIYSTLPQHLASVDPTILTLCCFLFSIQASTPF